MKQLRFVIIILLCSFSAGYGQHKHQRLQITPNGHFLQFKDGTPFFWLGDTGWDLFFKLNLKQIKTYLDNRAAKGFNLIQAVAISERNGLRTPNRYGELPLKDLDPARPNGKYFALIDSTIALAAARDIFIGLLPTWGDKVTKMWGAGPEIFDTLNAYTYGKWLGNRYKNAWNIIWIAGGDRPAFNDSLDWRPVWRAMIRGIRDGTDGKAIVTYHPWGEASSTKYWLSDSSYLDINMMQSGHRIHDFPVWNMVQKDYALQPSKPVIDGEPNYEDHPVNWDPKKGYFWAYDVRKQLYRSVFSGACGVTYGHNSVFQFYGPGDEKINAADRYWTDALDRPGAFQAGFLKKLILSRPPVTRVPDQSLIISGQGADDAHHITAFRDADNTYAMIYLPVGRKIEINTAFIPSKTIKIYWYNPAIGKVTKSFSIHQDSMHWFTPPTTGAQNDWVLVLDDPSKNYAIPGTLHYSPR
ncbi:glycoside hydrolase family 140 protein [Arachidicoccus terrestris]|uniref:glycoside hydrolase family 140 protein n=1 Tax=Arachidicoccus terrestris TaxID=2875539 RepID=UPI001CC65987|nr:glycoside hydrolase family 140 protein [Arachidicoccus terrestris]UAY55483.1 glycoside hydrolase family 140 protein [Arachidicoccus terrestris]